MAKEVWVLEKPAAEGGSPIAIKFPNDWNESEDLFYLSGIWVDGLNSTDTPLEVVLSTNGSTDVEDSAVGYDFLYYGGFQELPNPLVLAKDYAFLAAIGSTGFLRFTLFGDRKSSKTNPNLALVTFNTAVYEIAPSVG